MKPINLDHRMRLNDTAFPFADANGNCVSFIDEAGNVQAHYTYDAFGGTVSQAGAKAADFRFRFSSKYLDNETGLYYYGVRYYASALGRWVNRDPIEENGGLLLYGFVNNEIVNLIDVFGFMAVDPNRTGNSNPFTNVGRNQILNPIGGIYLGLWFNKNGLLDHKHLVYHLDYWYRIYNCETGEEIESDDIDKYFFDSNTFKYRGGLPNVGTQQDTSLNESIYLNLLNNDVVAGYKGETADADCTSGEISILIDWFTTNIAPPGGFRGEGEVNYSSLYWHDSINPSADILPPVYNNEANRIDSGFQYIYVWWDDCRTPPAYEETFEPKLEFDDTRRGR